MEGNVDPKLFEAIGFFEKMLQTMPDDRTSLEFLAVAYEQAGEQDKQIKTLIKLSETLLKEGDADHAAIIAKKLKSFVAVPEALAAARVAEMILSKGDVISASRVAGPISNQLFIDAKDQILTDLKQDGVAGGVQSWSSEAAKKEIDIVWYWKDNGILPKEVCMELLHVFMDHPLTDIPILVSALGILEEKYPDLVSSAFESMQKRSGMVPIPLELYEVSRDTALLLPLDYIKVKGVMPFSLIADELLVGVMNPMDESLRSEITRLSGKVCHFFLIHPHAWNTCMKQVFGMPG